MFFLLKITCLRSCNILNHSYNLFKTKSECLYKSLGCLYSRSTVLQDLKKSQLETDSIEKKIVFNSKIKYDIGKTYYKRNDTNLYSLNELERPPVIALKYFESDTNYETVTKSKEDITATNKDEYEKFNLPYDRYHHIKIDSSLEEYTSMEDEELSSNQNIDVCFENLKDKASKKCAKTKWLKDYNKYTEVSVKSNDEEDEESSVTVDMNYGSADPNVPPSTVPCGGCGAHLHCQDFAIPGYLPKEIFLEATTEQLQALVCQRCHFLREYNTALSVSVDPEMYPRLLSKIKMQKALVVLVVDMTDFPCSIWPGILDILGHRRPLFVVGNKIDLLQDVSKDWLQRAKHALVKQLPPNANLLHVTLVSAKTGYGIEGLITSLYNFWQYRGDVYLVGCTNVGKSTLFNALLQSDYCKTKAVDLLQQATTAPWPGTTLNLLKFPILRPEGWRVAMRTRRLRFQSANELQQIQDGKTTASTPQMISRINRTFSSGNTNKFNDDYHEDPFALPKMRTLKKLKAPGSGLDPDDPDFANSKWLFDTPGVVTPDQFIDLLTTEELMLTLPREPITPRTFQVWQGQSLLIAGLARVDYLNGSANIKMTVLASSSLPVTICFTADTESVYNHYLGSEVLTVPCGGKERLKVWPGLQAAPPFVLKGDGWEESCADVVLSSSGWIAVTAQQDMMCQLQAWTPRARGIHVRIPPVLPRAIALKGCKMYKSQAYAIVGKFKKRIINRL